MSDIVIKQFNKFLYFFHFYFNLREAVNLKSLTFSINHAPLFRVLKGVWRVYRYIPNALSLKASTITHFAQTLIVNHSMHLLSLEAEDSLLSRNIALQTEMPNAFSSFINAIKVVILCCN